MDEGKIIETATQLGFSAVFLWLYLRERSRASELSDRVMEVQRNCMDRLTRADK